VLGEELGTIYTRTELKKLIDIHANVVQSDLTAAETKVGRNICLHTHSITLSCYLPSSWLYFYFLMRKEIGKKAVFQ
tara:strand:- start:1459 stop:1689 length:231 start_codon:yes stop_codon:yes gene_type:complete